MNEAEKERERNALPSHATEVQQLGHHRFDLFLLTRGSDPPFYEKCTGQQKMPEQCLAEKSALLKSCIAESMQDAQTEKSSAKNLPSQGPGNVPALKLKANGIELQIQRL